MRAVLAVFVVLMSAPSLGLATPLVNANQLVAVLEEVGKQPVSGAEKIRFLDNVTRRASSRVEGYSEEVSFTTRMMSAPSTPDALGSVTNMVYAIPTVVLMPDNPAKNPLILIHNSVEISSEIMDRIVANKAVQEQIDIIAKGKDGFFQPWAQSDTFTAEITPKENHFNVLGKMDISQKSERDMEKFFDGYVWRIGSFNTVIRTQGVREFGRFYDEETARVEAYEKKLFKQTFKAIPDKRPFMKLVGWQLNPTNQVEDPASEFGHWEYENIDASPDVNVFVEVINHVDYYEMIFFVPYEESLGSDKIATLVTKLNDTLSGKRPPGAASAVAMDSDYKGLAQVIVTYDLTEGVLGKTIYSNAEAFDKYVNKYYRKLEKVAEKM